MLTRLRRLFGRSEREVRSNGQGESTGSPDPGPGTDAPGPIGRALRAIRPSPVERRRRPTELDEATLVDESGCFSEHVFEEETGYTTTEFIVEYLADHGGGVRQQGLVESLPWSDSKVSRLLSELEGQGRVIRHRVGREKAVFLPESSPRGAASTAAFDDVGTAQD